jgi:GNAT superfamily N-acetyltransferase
VPVEPLYGFEQLQDHHVKADFRCGVDALDRYFRERALHEFKKHVAATLVLVERATGAVIGFYTLSSLGIDAGSLPPKLAMEIPRYPRLPATLLGRMAVDESFRGRGFGGVLLIDALRRAFENRRTVASIAVVVDAKGDQARDFYLHYGFHPFSGHSHRLFIMMETIEQMISRMGMRTT